MRGTVSLSEQQQVTEASDSSNSSSTSAFLASSSATELKESAAAPVSPAAHGGVALLSPVPGGLIMPTKGKCMGIPHPRPRVPLKNPKGLSMPVAPGLTSPPIPRKVSHKDSPHTPRPPKCPPPGFSVGKGPIECADGIHSGPIDGSWWCKGWQAGYKKGSQDGWEEAFLKGAAKGYDRGYQVGYTRIYGQGPSWKYPAPSHHPKPQHRGLYVLRHARRRAGGATGCILRLDMHGQKGWPVRVSHWCNRPPGHCNRPLGQTLPVG